MSEGTATPWLTSQLVGERHHWGERIMGFLDEAGLIEGPSTIICKRSMLLK
jgi:hypothetical protein